MRILCFHHVLQKSGDPRRPNEVVDYKWPVVDSDKQVPDLPQVGGLIFGALGIMLKVGVCASDLSVRQQGPTGSSKVGSKVQLESLGQKASCLPSQQAFGCQANEEPDMRMRTGTCVHLCIGKRK